MSRKLELRGGPRDGDFFNLGEGFTRLRVLMPQRALTYEGTSIPIVIAPRYGTYLLATDDFGGEYWLEWEGEE